MRGSLFTRDFLDEGITETQEWAALSDDALTRFADGARDLFARFPTSGDPNEDRTEDDLIHPIAALLGWRHRIPQANLSPKGRRDVPDSLLFATEADKAAADAEARPERKFLHGLAILESKRWARDLDKAGSDGTPSSQILRYLHRAGIHSNRRIGWGILTNGRKWRLYWRDAKSQLEDFFELDLPIILGVDGVPVDDLFSVEEAGRDHHLRLFLLMFGRMAFVSDASDGRSFHLRAVEKSKDWEARVADDLGNVVFNVIFPGFVSAIAAQDPDRPERLPDTYLDEVRRAALILLYRLLFVFYAEDRNLLPTHDEKYDDYSLYKLRREIAQRIDVDDDFSAVQDRYYTPLKSLFRAIDQGDESIGLPPYNGGLFYGGASPLLNRVSIPDRTMAPLIDALSRQAAADGTVRRWISYRDLSVRQLGSIYERLLEYAVVPDEGSTSGFTIRPNIFARKGSGSYYTPDDLVELIVTRTLAPLIEERWDRFVAKAGELERERRPRDQFLAHLAGADPAAALLDLKVCDPAMGSGHFLVFVVDYLADTILRLTEEARDAIDGDDYVSPVLARVEDIRRRIVEQAREHGWTVDEQRLEPRHIVRRMILKRTIYGVDKNPMAVELAKVALWLHTFTVGAPLSFLDHHLRCGDSLYGENVRPVEDALNEGGFGLFIADALRDAKKAAVDMEVVEGLTDIDVAEVGQSANRYRDVETRTDALTRFLDFFHALRWLDRPVGKKTPTDAAALLDGHLGDPMRLVAHGYRPEEDGPPVDQGSLIPSARPEQMRLGQAAHVDGATRADAIALLRRAGEIAEREGFLHWQVAFPGVWKNWESAEPTGGFDAVVGNPPWDRIKLQEVEWFAERRPEIARQAKASDRKKRIAKLIEDGDPLADLYEVAKDSAESAARVARKGGYFPLLSSGDINLYSLFVERAAALVKPDGMVGLLVPSGIAADKGASAFFKGVATSGRLAALFDFENKKVFFPEVHASFKFCTLILGGRDRRFDETDTAFFLHAVGELDDPARAFPLTAEDFARVNPNTGTAPIFRTRRDAEITRGIYDRVPVLHDHNGKNGSLIWQVRYTNLFHMAGDSHLFKTANELEKEGFYRVEYGRFKRSNECFSPLYVGRMIHQFDHRAASVLYNSENQLNRFSSQVTDIVSHKNVSFFPIPEFYVPQDAIEWPVAETVIVAFRDIARSTDERTVISALIPYSGAAHTLGVLVPLPGEQYPALEIVANLNSFILDFVARQKVQTTHLTWYTIEQFPVIPLDGYRRRFGTKTAAEIVKEHVLHLTYTAWDMQPFARDMGYDGDPFVWDEDDRRRRRAILDALFFHLYGIQDEDDVRYILSTFPIVEREDRKAFGDYRTAELIVNYMRALAAGEPDAEIVI